MSRQTFKLVLMLGVISALLGFPILSQAQLSPPKVLRFGSSGLVPVQLTSTQTGLLPYTVGLAFKAGDIPGYPSINGAQVVVKRRWNDGSVKHAIVSGESNFSGSAIPLPVTNSSSAPSGADLTSADIQAAAPSASVQLGNIGTVNLTTLLASPFRTWISGPLMVECHYRSPVGSDPTLAVWFYVRLYKHGRIWIRAIVENGYVDVTPNDKSYVPTVIIGGATVFSNSGSALTHYAHTRWTAEGWIGGNPQVVPKHDPTYLISTKLVPNYWKRSPSAATLNALVQTYAPMGRAGLTQSMGAAGFQNQIGLLPLWDALYATTGDSRAYNSVLANSSALNSYPIVWKDSASGLPPKPSSYPNTTLAADNYSAGSLSWELNHHPSEGYLAYILSGDYWHYETALLQTSLIYLMKSTAIYTPYGGGGVGLNRILTFQTRGTAWNIRTISQAVGIAPTGDAVASDYATLLSNNVAYWVSIINSLGGTGIGYIYEYGASGNLDGYGPGLNSPWMQHFWMQSMGLGSDIEPLASMTNFNAVRDWLYRGIVGILGDSNGYGFAYASNYSIKISNGISLDPTTWYRTWPEVWNATFTPPPAYTNTLQGSSAGIASEAPTGYWGNLLPAIAYAVDHSAAGASAAWSRLTGSTNWATVEGSGFDNTPIWGIVPRFSPNPILSNLQSNSALDLGVYSLNSTPAGGINENSITDYSGFVYSSDHASMLMFGGGHSATMADYIARLKLDASSDLTWTPDYSRTSIASMTSANAGANGIWTSTGFPMSRHTYDMLSYASNVGKLVMLTMNPNQGDNLSFDPSNYVTTPKVMTYSPSSKSWSVSSASANSSWIYYSSSEYDPISGMVIVLDPYDKRKLSFFNPSTNSITDIKVVDIPAMGYAQNLVYCPYNDKFYWIKSGSPVRVWEINLNRSSWSSSTVSEITAMSNAPTILNETGWAWNDRSKVIGGGVQSGHFFAYDPLTKQWTDKAMISSSGSIGTLAFHALAFDSLNGVFIFITDGASGRHTWAYKY